MIGVEAGALTAAIADWSKVNAPRVHAASGDRLDTSLSIKGWFDGSNLRPGSRRQAASGKAG
jgi:hypothetical protein